MPKQAVHKVNKDLEALCMRYPGPVVPGPGLHARSWTKVTCKNCLAQKPDAQPKLMSKEVQDRLRAHQDRDYNFLRGR